MKKAVFYIDGGPAYIGYTNGDRWNGWATPYFTFEEAQRLQTDWNRETDFPMLYDVSKDEFRVKYDGDDVPYIWKGEDIQTVDGKLHLYGIGAYSHIWDKADKDDKRYLAQIISDFLYDYDPHKYDDSDNIIEAFVIQFSDIYAFAEAYNIMNGTWDGDQTYKKLNEVFNI